MRRMILFALGCSLAPALVWAEPASIGSTQATRLVVGASSNCAPVYLHTDGTYEDGVAWRTGGVQAPDFGAFAEQFEGAKSICAFVADLTQSGGFENGQTADFFIWDNETSDAGDTPGAVLYAMHDVSPWPIAFWPEISRTVAPLPQAFNVSGKWWVGIWGNWPGQPNAWYVAVDTNGPSTHIPKTNIIASGYPPGWQPVNAVWGATVSVGIGVEGTPVTPASVPGAAFELSSFGRVKSLYR